MNSVSERCAVFLWRARWPLVATLLVVTLFALQALRSLGVSNSLEAWYPANDPELLAYQAFQANYGSDEIIVVAVRGETPLDDEDGLTRVADLTDKLLDVDGVANVTSLVTVPESLAAARGRLLSADRRTSGIIVQTMPGAAIEARRAEIIAAIRTAVTTSGFEAHLAGYGVIFKELNEASTTGAAVLVSSAHLVMFALLWLLFRRLLPVLLTLTAVAIATIWTMGLYAGNGHDLNMVTMILPTLVLVIGIANCMHLLRRVAGVDRRLPQRERVVTGLSAVLAPCFVMSVTTAAGFLGLTLSTLPVVRELGAFGAVGVLIAFAVTVASVTAALTWRIVEPEVRSSGLDRLARRLHACGASYPRAVIGVFAVICLVSAIGIGRLQADTDSLGYLPESHPARQDSDFIEAELGPYLPVEFTIRATDSLFTGPRLDAIWRWQQQIAAAAGVGWSWSVLNALAVPDARMPSELGTGTLTKRLDRMRRLSPVTARGMLRGDNEFRVSFGAPVMSARSVRELVRAIATQAELPPGVTVQPAGYAPLYTRIVDEIVASQVRGFALALLLVVALIGIATGCWRRLLLAIPANLVPVIVTLGLMGFAGIPLDVATATIASVILGLVVDDTVHLLRPVPGASTAAALRTTARRCGGTLLMTSLVLIAGFLLLGLAEIRSIAWFGVLTSVAVAVAVLNDLVLLPAMAAFIRPVPARGPAAWAR